MESTKSDLIRRYNLKLSTVYIVNQVSEEEYQKTLDKLKSDDGPKYNVLVKMIEKIKESPGLTEPEKLKVTSILTISAAKYVPHSKMLNDIFGALKDVYKKINPKSSSGLLYDDDYFKFMTDAKPQRDYIDKRDQSQKRFTNFVHAYGLMKDRDREKLVDLINERIKEDRFKLDPKAGIMKIQTSVSKITDEDLEEIEKEIGKDHSVSYGEYGKQR